MTTHRLAEKCLNFRRFEKLQNLNRGRDQIIRNYKSIEIHDVLNINPSSTGKFSTTGVRFYKPLSWVYVVEMYSEIYHLLL